MVATVPFFSRSVLNDSFTGAVAPETPGTVTAGGELYPAPPQ